MRDLKDVPAVRHIITSDGSSTLFSPVFDQHYHSVHGAIQESMHVFIQAGLQALPQDLQEVRVFEMGFGTGLNALLTCMHREGRSIHYVAIEAYPISPEQANELNYISQLPSEETTTRFAPLHTAEWEQAVEIEAGFVLEKRQVELHAFSAEQGFDVIYFDAFAPTSQPDLWTDEVMEKMAGMLNPGGLFVTYSAKSSVRRGLQQAGLEVEKIPGPPGKREMLRAWRR